MKINNILAILTMLTVPDVAEAGSLSRNWGLSDTQTPKAWTESRSHRIVRVFVLDTGIDVDHPEFRGRICHPKSGDEYGWDFVADRKNPTDSHGHGTHVAGIIRSVSPTACVAPVKYYSDRATGQQNLDKTVMAIDYAVEHGAQVINYSGGGAEFSSAEMRAIQRAETRGVLFVASAGNEFSDTDLADKTYYPAGYALSNIIGVSSVSYLGEPVPSSNWGLKHVHVAAPGENILSTLPGNRYGYLTGTSQAAAFVSGLAAFILSEVPGLKPQEVRDIIMGSVNQQANLKGKVASGGKINVYKALVAAKKYVRNRKEAR